MPRCSRAQGGPSAGRSGRGKRWGPSSAGRPPARAMSVRSSWSPGSTCTRRALRALPSRRRRVPTSMSCGHGRTGKRGGRPMPLMTGDPIVAIDGRLATRRMGRSKGPEADVVLLDALGIETVGELLHHYPRRYIDRSLVLPIGQLTIDAFATVIATVRSVKKRQTRRRQAMVTVTIGDGTGFLDLTFFNQPWAAGLYREGMEGGGSGTVQLFRHRLQLANQEIEVLRSDEQDLVHTGRITPVHRAAEGINPRTIRELMWRALEQLPPLADPIPDDVREAESLTERDRALRWIHFPADQRELETARERLKFDELFTLELGVGFRRRRLAAERTGIAHVPSAPLLDAFDASVPFEPTGAQGPFRPRSAALRSVGADRRQAPRDRRRPPSKEPAGADEPAAAG